MENLLEIKNLKTYLYSNKNEIRAVDGIDLIIKQGETVALVGESGCGKSMTSLSIMGLIPKPNGKIIEGEIILEDTNLISKSEKEMTKIRGNEIAMIFQDPMTSLNPVLTIGNQLISVIIHHLNLSKNEAKIRAIEMLEMVGFSEPEAILKNYPHRLSGGMRQRVMIAMAMSCNPKLLIADEPTTALDVTIQAQVLELMKELSQRFSTSILLITHDLGVVSELADKVVVMYAGQIVEVAEIEDLFEKPLHPYTQGLIESVPKISGDIEKLYSIPGNVPAPGTIPKGCKFAPRCKFAFDKCKEVIPSINEVEDGRQVRCFLYDE